MNKPKRSKTIWIALASMTITWNCSQHRRISMQYFHLVFFFFVTMHKQCNFTACKPDQWNDLRSISVKTKYVYMNFIHTLITYMFSLALAFPLFFFFRTYCENQSEKKLYFVRVSILYKLNDIKVHTIMWLFMYAFLCLNFVSYLKSVDCRVNDAKQVNENIILSQ